MRIAIIITVLFISQLAPAQSTYPDSLLNLLDQNPDDSLRFRINQNLALHYFNRDRRKTFVFNEEALEIARKNNKMLDIAICLSTKGYLLNKEDRYGEALKCYIYGFRLAENPASERQAWTTPLNADSHRYRMQVLAGLHHEFGLMMRSTNNNKEAIRQFRICLQYLDKALPTSHNSALMNIGAVYLDMKVLDSAMFYLRKAIANKHMAYRPTMYKYTGDVFFLQGNIDSARHYYHKGNDMAKKLTSLSQLITNQLGLAKTFLAEKNQDSSLFYAGSFMERFKELHGNPVKDINISNAYELLYRAYQLSDLQDSTLKYLQLAFIARDSISESKIRNLTQYQNITFEEQIRLEELEKEKLRTQSRIRTYSLLAGLVFILIVAFILFRNARQKHKANSTLKNTLKNLKATQAQLIQSEKMASLGELTAGIAHEIQNPLNFVNNFSEVNNELLDELQDELKAGNVVDAIEISNDIKENGLKINHHGKRADAIVKGMLQHSRASSGIKEPTDLNALADEYLRLSFHGLRAKDKSLPGRQAGFNADFKTEFDADLPKIEVIPQDIGRVLLNLINNAFYAVSEKAKLEKDEYKPEVVVSTKKLNDSIEIRVKDNGNGVPDSVKDKIFQPFFTTKPTGEGTGLGLSMSYEIITKGHGGRLLFETLTKPGHSEEIAGTAFIITLPLNQSV
ncbi:MAG: hypothetical protein K9H16_05450 [Bacteroidales bacterium]|nr:hypothetical protein [Bacteroidales bacterium]